MGGGLCCHSGVASEECVKGVLLSKGELGGQDFCRLVWGPAGRRHAAWLAPLPLGPDDLAGGTDAGVGGGLARAPQG